jgi:hypothetical protein
MGISGRSSADSVPVEKPSSVHLYGSSSVPITWVMFTPPPLRRRDQD